MKKWLLWVWLTGSLVTGYALDKRTKPAHYTVSVVIPCHPLHFKYLKRVLDAYQMQTVLPMEVVISASQIYQVPPEDVAALRALSYPFALRLAESNERLLAGANRRAASAIAAGDIIVYQDADDIPHKQRVEIIKNYFEKYKVYHLLHRYTPDTVPFQVDRYSNEMITLHELESISSAGMYFSRIQFGQCAIAKKVLKHVSWDTNMIVGEDMKFCNELIDRYHRSVLIDAELVSSGTSGLPGMIEKGLL